MAMCVSCGKHGIFLRLDSNGLCKQCAKEAERRERDECHEAFKRERERKASEPLPAEHPIQKSKSPIPGNRIWGYSHVATAQINLQRIHDRGAELDFAYHDLDEEDVDILPTHTVVTAEPLGNIGELCEYAVLDFETTGLSCTQDRIIEIGAMKISCGIEINSMSTFVNPGSHIPEAITQLTGISDDNVSDAPDIITAISALHEFVGGLPIVAHNASFDIGFLRAAYEKANISESINYIDTLQLARKAFPNAENHKLATLITYLSLGSTQDHRALSDVRFTNALFQKCLEKIKDNDIEISSTQPLPSTANCKKQHPPPYVRPSEISKTVDCVDCNHPLYGKNLVFTGELSIGRKEAMQMAVNSGALIKTAVSKKTDFLVVGRQDIALVGEDGMSTKEEKAYELVNSGKADISIIGEEEFTSLVKGKEPIEDGAT